MKISLETLFRDQPAEVRTKVGKLSGILQRSIGSVRDMAYDLRPPGLDQLGLVRTLYLYCEEFSKSSPVEIDFAAAGVDELSLEYETEINIYRLIQEALNNIKRHAEADRGTIRLVASSPPYRDPHQGQTARDSTVNRRRKQALKEKRTRGCKAWWSGSACWKERSTSSPRPGKGSYIRIEIPVEGEVQCLLKRAF